MNKLAAWILILFTLLFLTGCGGDQASSRGSVVNNSGNVSQLLEPSADDAAAQGQAVPEEAETQSAGTDASVPRAADSRSIDIDLTQMSSTMVYSEVLNMLTMPDDYIGKIIRVRGWTASYMDDYTDEPYYAVIIPDATACCAEGIEYLLTDEYEYPEPKTEATITGEFETFEEKATGILYCRLKDATINT